MTINPGLISYIMARHKRSGIYRNSRPGNTSHDYCQNSLITFQFAEDSVLVCAVSYWPEDPYTQAIQDRYQFQVSLLHTRSSISMRGALAISAQSFICYHSLAFDSKVSGDELKRHKKIHARAWILNFFSLQEIHQNLMKRRKRI